MSMIELTQTDLHLTRMHGHVEIIDDMTIARVPDNPGYRWGNCLHLPHAPTADTLDDCIQRARDLFADQPQSTHVQLRWDGDAIEDDLKEHAATKGLRYENGRAMHATELTHVQIPGIEIRPLDIEHSWDDIVALNIACDPEEIDGTPDYVAFKQGLTSSMASMGLQREQHAGGAHSSMADLSARLEWSNVQINEGATSQLKHIPMLVAKVSAQPLSHI